ncbi:beta-glucosidase [Amycolatopsis bartoniae]|uniref:Exo-alpha-(1->6)-L-arabinopyranosidase n=1 Tax=Amycolatopsis bartoniae TaxID=941986 RepID=A0A8H9M556_9PSEU|nr:glycoside hydrolase family 3 protein [Amycolatopsis bartoniae]MBB2940074.1 beta-glucosidase [Amycolatopsis bartoniae]TVT09447.1 carbohydrate-binding protein [Amycolatopsis bartoniae]GHF53766.1 beta-glucosidase [Amycolatopsis bartoniae]
MTFSLSRRRLLQATAAAIPVAAVAPRTGTSSPFRDPDLPLAPRLADLLSRLTLDEKISLLHQYQPAIPRLGIGRFKTGTEALHGVAWTTDIDNGGAVVTAKGTTFPQAIGLGNTWDPALLRRIGTVVGTEARGYHSQNSALWSLNLWAPVVNLLRDPRWGRNEEGYSEDPYLTGRLSTAYCQGLRGDDPRYLLAAPTLKHYLAYNNEVDRTTSNSSVPPEILHDYDQQAFRPALAAGAATGVMPSYNLVNGRPNTVSPDLDATVRSWSREDLMIVSDAGAPSNLTDSEKYYATKPEAVAAALKAGLDSFTDNDTNSNIILAAVHTALDQGLLAESDVDDAVRHILSIRFRLGEFDPPGRNPYAGITSSVIDSPEHRALARQAAQEQIVLLRNDNGVLPLAVSQKIAVVGPLTATLYTDWYGGSLPYGITPLQGISDRVAAVTTSEGVDRIALRDNASGRYLTASSSPDGGPLVASGTSAGPGQAMDVFDWGAGKLTLRTVANGKYLSFGPGRTLVNNAAQPNGWYVQQQLKLTAQPDGYVLEYAGNDVTESWFGTQKYAVVGSDGTVAFSASTVDTASRFTREVLVSGVDAAVEAARAADAAVVVVGSMPFINGREANDRTSTALAGAQQALVAAVQQANPKTVVVVENSYPTTGWQSVRVPAILWTTHAGQETGRALADVLFGDVNPGGRLTQTWYASDDQLPSILDYDIARTGMTYLYHEGEVLYPFGYGLSYTSFRYHDLRVGPSSVTVNVTNTGTRAGDDVVQLYVRHRESRIRQPLKQLRGFERVSLRPGETKRVTFSLRPEDLAFWDVTRERFVVEAGGYDVLIGHNARDIALSAPLFVPGERIPPRNVATTTPAQNFDDYSGATLTDYSKAAGTSVAVTSGSWLAYRDAALSTAQRRFTLSASKEDAGVTRATVRLDSPSGRILGTLSIASTGDHYRYADFAAELAPPTGRHDLYLTFDGAANVSSFRLA